MLSSGQSASVGGGKSSGGRGGGGSASLLGDSRGSLRTHLSECSDCLLGRGGRRSLTIMDLVPILPELSTASSFRSEATGVLGVSTRVPGSSFIARRCGGGSRLCNVYLCATDLDRLDLLRLPLLGGLRSHLRDFP